MRAIFPEMQAEAEVIHRAGGVEPIARALSGWYEAAAQFHRNEQFYRGLLEQIGEIIGEEAYIADDGSRSDEVLCLKLPELVKRLAGEG